MDLPGKGRLQLAVLKKRGRYDLIEKYNSDFGKDPEKKGSKKSKKPTDPSVTVVAEDGKAIENASILDIAPTIAKIMGVPAPREWEGKELV